MARRRAVVIAALLGAWLAASAGCDRPAPAASQTADGRPILRVLFLGNSYTYVNDLPLAVQALAKAAGSGPVLEVQTRATAGATLENHWNGGAPEAIRDKPWNFVVLQEQSVTPLATVGRDTLFFPNARKLDAAIKARGATTVFYMTWKRPDTGGTQEDWTQPYLDISRELGARVAPAGMALELVLRKKPGFAFFADAGGHPTPAGTYLVACAIYAAIFERSPAGLPASVTTAGGQKIGVPDEDAALVQGAVWDAFGAAKKRLSAEK